MVEMPDQNKWMVSDLSLAAVRSESARAIVKHGWNGTPLNPEKTRGFKLAVLVEEVGEVARILCDFEQGILSPEETKSQIIKELVQVAAVSTMWMECEDVMDESTWK